MERLAEQMGDPLVGTLVDPMERLAERKEDPLVGTLVDPRG